MTISPLTPIVVGVGEVKNASKRPDVAREPLDLILEAIRNAVRDSGTQENSILPTVDSIAVVPPWTWAYEDLPGLVASKLRVKASHLVCGSHGGNQPALLCDQVAQRVSVGESRVAIIAGGEALASCEFFLTALNMVSHELESNVIQWRLVRKLGKYLLRDGQHRTRHNRPLTPAA